METAHVLDIARSGMKVAILLAGPLLTFGLVVGVLTNIFQAVTQISETTLAVVPKMLAILLAALIFAPWMIDLMTDFTTSLFLSIPEAVR